MRIPSLLSTFALNTILLVCFVLLMNVPYGTALQNLIPPQLWKFPTLLGNGGKSGTTTSKISTATLQLENDILEAIANVENRLSNDERIESLINQLESIPTSISEPAISSQIYGKWRLLYTTAATTSSPIQRRAVNAQQFPIYQDIVIVKSSSSRDSTNDADKDSIESADRLVVKQIVKFTDTISLSVDALASTAAYPLEELQPRQGTGKILGMNLLGVSLVGDEAQPDIINKPNARIDFVFDEGNFYIGNDWKIPYPVPFRLPILRDAVKGWIDITYLSDRIRISRGNKGTTFVLLKEKEQ